MNRTKKIAIAGIVAGAVILAIVLPVTLNNNKSERNTKSEEASDSRPSEISGDELPSCPCFSMDDLDKAMSDITGDGGYTYQEDSSCTGNRETGINYSKDDTPMGYSVGEGFCQEFDAIHGDITVAEEIVCRALIDAKCAENDIELDIAYIPEFTCPCFDEDKLDEAFDNIIGGAGASAAGGNDPEYIFDADSSCTGGVETGVNYHYLVDGQHPVPMGYSVSSLTCQEGDALHMLDDVGQEVACRSLIESKCDEYENDI